MFSWLRDKTTTTTSYDYIPNDQPPIVSNPRPQTTPSVSHQKQYSNGREFFMVLIDVV